MKTFTGETALLDYLNENKERPTLWVSLIPANSTFSNSKRTAPVHTCIVETSDGKAKFTGISEEFYDSDVVDFDTRVKRSISEDSKEEDELWDEGD